MGGDRMRTLRWVESFRPARTVRLRRPDTHSTVGRILPTGPHGPTPATGHALYGGSNPSDRPARSDSGDRTRTLRWVESFRPARTVRLRRPDAHSTVGRILPNQPSDRPARFDSGDRTRTLRWVESDLTSLPTGPHGPTPATGRALYGGSNLT